MMVAYAAYVWAIFGRQAGNHLWQSTAFAAVAALLALAFRKNSARVRHWLWMAASVKFLVPFALIATLGSRLGTWLIPRAPAPRLSLLAVRMTEPFVMPDGVFATPSTNVAAPHSAVSLWPALLLAVWLSGSMAILFHWLRRWRQLRSVVRTAKPLQEGRVWEALERLGGTGHRSMWAVRRGSEPRQTTQGDRLSHQWGGSQDLPSPKLVSSSAPMEPGVFGIFRPVLWLPEGIGDRLSDAELEAILAHELCHLQRRDNLAAAIHMAVEALFWFHPLVWWLGGRLVEERERACDEAVVHMTSEPEAYAEGVLKVCEFYVASPLECAAGVTGADLRKRIEGIMSDRFAKGLSFGKRMLLVAAALVAVGAPFAIGMAAPQNKVQAQAPAEPLAFDAASVKAVVQDWIATRPTRSGGGLRGPPTCSTWCSMPTTFNRFAFRAPFPAVTRSSSTRSKLQHRRPPRKIRFG